MYCIIRTISKKDYVIDIENEIECGISIKEYIKDIMSNDLFEFTAINGYEYFINTKYIEGFKIEK